MATDCVAYLPDWSVDGAFSKYRFMKVSASAGKLDLAGAADRPIGVSYDDVASGVTGARIDIADIQNSQAIKVEVGAAIAANAAVGCGANGKLVTKSGTDDIVLGYVKEAFAVGEIATMYVAKFDKS